MTLLLIVGLAAINAQNELPYKPFSEFQGDTLRYLEYNYTTRAEQYVGKTVGVVLEECELPITQVVNLGGVSMSNQLTLISLGIRQIGIKPSVFKDYYIEIRFATPPPYDKLIDVCDPWAKDNWTPQVYDFIKDLQIKSITSNPYIIGAREYKLKMLKEKALKEKQDSIE